MILIGQAKAGSRATRNTLKIPPRPRHSVSLVKPPSQGNPPFSPHQDVPGLCHAWPDAGSTQGPHRDKQGRESPP